jgi:hypothetical protein
VPAFAGLGPAFLGFVLPAAACLVGAAWALLVADAEADAPDDPAWQRGGTRASAWLKGAMALGIVALALARLS